MTFQLPFQREHMSRLIKSELTVALTPLGKQKADAFSGEGPKFDILATLNESGPSSISELAQETGMSPVKVKHVLKELAKAGYVRRVGESG